MKLFKTRNPFYQVGLIILLVSITGTIAGLIPDTKLFKSLFNTDYAYSGTIEWLLITYPLGALSILILLIGLVFSRRYAKPKKFKKAWVNTSKQ